MKRRRKYKGLYVVAGLLAVGVLYGVYRIDLRPVTASGAARTFVVDPGQDAQAIATDLKSDGLVRNRNAFITYVNIHGLRPSLKAGDYSISPAQSSEQIALEIADGHTISMNLIIPEGYRLAQIQTAAAKLGISNASFAAALASPHAQSFLSSKPAGVSLEGYLFPDSYQIDPTTTAAELVNDMLDNFGRRVGPAYVQAFAAEGLTLHEGLTVASIVESEVANPSDRPIVAQIFLKRLKVGMPLGSDVTAEYAANLLGVPFTTAVNSP
ncbi:MAG TPA: endolytic transglycosylase MltG, partial [Candidatus Saccharimonadia bacterium]|nr:endolytic transglycosylase MltG [Candidatus Saccharimonadia bacterium]